MNDWKSVVTVSALSIVPVFLLLLVNYRLFGVEIPNRISIYLFYSFLTIVSGVIGFRAVGDLDKRWAVYSGLIRWVLAGLLFLSARLLAAVSGVPDPVSWTKVLTLQYLFEIPAMVLGYWIGSRIYNTRF
jgi:hypothetical protein